MEPARQTETERASDSSTVTFFVPGVPAPAGSKKAFFNPRQPRRPIVTDDSAKSRPWKTLVSSYAVEVFDGRALLTGPLALSLLFVFPRPKSHYGTGKNADKLKENAPHYHTSKPDVTKLIRAVEDALNQVVWRDDSQVVSQKAIKIYTNPGWPKAGVDVAIGLQDEIARF